MKIFTILKEKPQNRKCLKRHQEICYLLAVFYACTDILKLLKLWYSRRLTFIYTSADGLYSHSMFVYCININTKIKHNSTTQIRCSKVTFLLYNGRILQQVNKCLLKTQSAENIFQVQQVTF